MTNYWPSLKYCYCLLKRKYEKQQQRLGKQQRQPLHDVAMALIDITVKLQPRTACIMVFVEISMWHVRSSISDNLGQNIWDT